MAFERAIEIEPNNGNAHFGKGEAFYKLKRYSEALSAYEEALRLDHRLENVEEGRILEFLEEGCKFFQSHHVNEAHTVYLIAALFNSSQTEDYRVHSQVLFDEGKRLFELKHYEEALNNFEIAILLQRKNLRTTGTGYVVLGDTLIYKGEVLFQLKRFQEIPGVYKEVRSAYCHSLSLYNAKSSSLINKARDFWRKRSYAKSYAAYKRAILFNPQRTYIAEYEIKSEELLLRSLDFYERDQHEKALLMYDEAIQFNPDSLTRTFVEGRDMSEVRQHWHSERNRLNNSRTSGELNNDEEVIDQMERSADDFRIVKTTRVFEGDHETLWYFYLQ